MLKKIFKIFLYLIALFFFISIFLGFFIYKEIGISDPGLKRFGNLSYFDAKTGLFKSHINTDIALFDDLYSYVKFYFFTLNAPRQPMPLIRKNKDDFSTKAENLAFYWLGHSSVLAELKGLRVLIDPVFENASAFPFAMRRFAQPPIYQKDLPKLDIIIITHNHYDHLEKKSIQTLFARHYIVPLGLKKTLASWGVEEDKITELGWGDESEISGLTITAQSTIHYSGRSPFDKNKSLVNSYILSFDDKKFFFGSDGGYGAHFAQIGQKYGPFELVFLGIDGWHTKRIGAHLHPAQVIKACKDLDAKALVPLHWGVFNSGRNWKEVIEILYQNKKELKIIAPMMGERFEPSSSTKPWWRYVK